MAYLKLTNPGNTRGSHIFIPVPGGEIYTEILLDMDQEAVDRQAAVHERLDFEPRRFLLWAHMEDGSLQEMHDRLLEVIINGSNGEDKPQVIITNYNALLLNDKGDVVDRLFRYHPPYEGYRGGGVLQKGVNEGINGVEGDPDPQVIDEQVE